MILSSTATLSVKFRVAKDVRKPAECVLVVTVVTEWAVGKITTGTLRSAREQGVSEMAAYTHLISSSCHLANYAGTGGDTQGIVLSLAR